MRKKENIMAFEGPQTCVVASENKVVPVGSTVTLSCPSNDDYHIFKFWQFGNNQIIGPGNNYDQNKYKYEVLSGKLYIKNVMPNESGCYNCYSEHINGTSHNVMSVQMITKGLTHEAIRQATRTTIPVVHSDVNQDTDVTWDIVKIAAIIISFVVIIGCAILYYRLRKEWDRYDGRMVVPIDDDEEEGDEIYNRTTTTINPVAGPSRNASSDQLYGGIDNQGLDTDFNSVFQQIQIKSPQQSLI